MPCQLASTIVAAIAGFRGSPACASRCEPIGPSATTDRDAAVASARSSARHHAGRGAVAGQRREQRDLAGAEEALDLPLERPRPAAGSWGVAGPARGRPGGPPTAPGVRSPGRAPGRCREQQAPRRSSRPGRQAVGENAVDPNRVSDSSAVHPASACVARRVEVAGHSPETRDRLCGRERQPRGQIGSAGLARAAKRLGGVGLETEAPPESGRRRRRDHHDISRSREISRWLRVVRLS